MLVDSGIEIGAQLIGSGPEFFFEVVEKLVFDGVHRRLPETDGGKALGWAHSDYRTLKSLAESRRPRGSQSFMENCLATGNDLLTLNR